MLLLAHIFSYLQLCGNVLFLEDVGLTVLQDIPTCPAIFLNPDLMKSPPGERKMVTLHPLLVPGFFTEDCSQNQQARPLLRICSVVWASTWRNWLKIVLFANLLILQMQKPKIQFSLAYQELEYVSKNNFAQSFIKSSILYISLKQSTNVLVLQKHFHFTKIYPEMKKKKS